MNQESKEPFILDGRKLGGRSETERMIRILSALWKTDSESFDKAAEGVGGHIRLWFSRDRRQISNTGSSNHCRPIKDSPWYVSINCAHNGMRERVERVMEGMGFSRRYRRFVSSFICDEKGRLDEEAYFEDDDAVG